MELSGFGNRKGIEMENTVAEEKMDLIYSQYKGFKHVKIFLYLK